MSSGTPVEVRSTTDVVGPMRFSATRLGTWMKCPLQAKFKYTDRLPSDRSAYMAFGICVHAVLDEFYDSPDAEAAVERFLDLWEDPSLVRAAIDYWPDGTDYIKLRDRGEDSIRTYFEKQKLDKGKKIKAEHKFLVPFGEFELTGYVDLLEVRKGVRGNVLRIIDFKTGMYIPRQSVLNLDIQFTVYDYASRQEEFWVGNGIDYPGLPNGEEMFHLYKSIPRVPVWYAVAKGKEVMSRERDEDDHLRLYRLCKEIHHAETLGVYVPKIAEDTCVFCDYTRECAIPIDDTPVGEY